MPFANFYALLQTPKVFPSLLRCFMVRGQSNGNRYFKLYQGSCPESSDKKFLMAAEFGRFVP